MKQKTLFISAIAILFLAFVIGTLLYTSKPEPIAGQVSEVQRAALQRMHSPTIGKPDAPVVIVEFFDPACETCSAFYPLVKQLIAAHPDQIQLVLRYTPFHEGSEQVVAVLEAARRQGKFWPVLEALLAGQRDWVQQHKVQLTRVWPHLEGLGLDMERMQMDMTAPEIGSLIAQDLADARTLKVSKTPEFFVNGQPLPSFGFAQLTAMVEQALPAAPR